MRILCECFQFFSNFFSHPCLIFRPFHAQLVFSFTSLYFLSGSKCDIYFSSLLFILNFSHIFFSFFSIQQQQNIPMSKTRTFRTEVSIDYSNSDERLKWKLTSWMTEKWMNVKYFFYSLVECSTSASYSLRYCTRKQEKFNLSFFFVFRVVTRLHGKLCSMLYFLFRCNLTTFLLQVEWSGRNYKWMLTVQLIFLFVQ